MKIFKAIDLNWSAYKQTVINHISKTFTDFGQKYDNSTVFGQIITVMSATVQNILLYIEDAFVEQNKYTAIRRKSIYGLAQASGYNPSLGKAAGVQLKLSYIPTNDNAANVLIENHARVMCNQNGLVYNIVLPQDAIVVSADKDNTNKMLYAVEGTFETQSFVADGSLLYTLHVDFSGDVDDDYIEVKVNNEKWERVDSLYDMKPDGKQWFYKTSVISGIILGFGNNVFGRAIREGDEIKVTYLRHAGEYGNINTKEQVKFTFISPLIDIIGREVDGNNIFNISLASEDAVSSGSFGESQDQVKQMIGYNSRSLVLADKKNYEMFINRFSFCGYNRTWSEPGSLVVNSLIMRNYKSQLEDSLDYFKLKESDFYLTPNQKQSIQNYISKTGNQLAGVSYNIFDPEIKKYALYMYIKLKSSTYDQDYVSNKVRKIIGEYFSNLNSDIYVPKSDIIQLVKNNVDEIDGLDIYFISEANEDAIKTGKYKDVTYTFNPTTGTYNKKETMVYLYDGEDPGLGLDGHGNIYLQSNEQYPVLMGGWSYISSKDRDELTFVDDPLVINYV